MDGFELQGKEVDGSQDHVAPTWLKWSPRNSKRK